MSKARTLANLISDNAELADGQISVAEVVGAAPLANPTFTGTASGTFSGPLTGAVTGNVTGNLTGNVTGDVAGDIDLTAITATIAVTAVDVFVYDTSKDSDGGAWRKRTQGTSWYNETLNTATRGSRREFPAVAVIVAEATKVTIYDGDDPSLPMWMVFNGGAGNMMNANSCSSVAMLNGRLTVGNFLYDVVSIDFAGDRAARAGVSTIFGPYLGNVLTRNSNSGWASNTGSFFTNGPIVNRTVNDVAMTVLPNAPIDAATGLPVPTIAVATAGGVSVITDSGAVYDTTVGFTPVSKVSFDSEGGLWWFRNSSLYLSYAEMADYVAADGFGDLVASSVAGNQEFDLQIGTVCSDIAAAQSDGLLISGTGLGRHYLNTSALVSSANTHLHAYTTSTYNTGWMNGDIKGAFLSDTDDTDLVGSELVTNGTFDTDVSGWTITETGTGTATWDSGTASLKLTRNDLSNRGTASQTVSGTSGERYLLTLDVLAASDGDVAISINGVSSPSFAPSQKATYSFVSDGSDLIEILPQTSGGATVYIDNVSVRLAEEDRSVNGNDLQVFGTVTRSPVATGADLVAYSGFSASNYLEQPYNSDLDFGTGDCCGMAWFKHSDTALTRTIFDRDSATSDKAISFEIAATNSYLQISLDDGTDRVYVNSGVAVDNDVWHLGVWVRRGNTLELYLDGVLKNTGNVSSVDSISSTDARLRIGDYRRSALSLPFGGDIALVRLSATAPSPEQILKIYNDEKHLFTENAQATLYGSSDAVTALAYDDTTELLHVGTSAGRSVFQGLRRVDNTTDAVGAAISASNGLVAED